MRRFRTTENITITRSERFWVLGSAVLGLVVRFGVLVLRFENPAPSTQNLEPLLTTSWSGSADDGFGLDLGRDSRSNHKVLQRIGRRNVETEIHAAVDPPAIRNGVHPKHSSYSRR